jgi:hypothetical protein
MIELGVPQQQLDCFDGRAQMDEPGRHRTPAAMRRAAAYAGVTVQLRNVRL